VCVDFRVVSIHIKKALFYFEKAISKFSFVQG
jgi:hypothetical protein